MKRTPDIEPGTTFEVEIPITKAYVDGTTGKRHIVGVASGVAVDRDGERVSKNGVRGMVKDVADGGVALTSGHQQDWLTEIGDIIKAEHDAKTDEFILDSVLPAEGVDPIADKAWRTANTRKVGFSVGGKLLKSYFERDELGKKRKVLDAIKLKHVALTLHPSYPHSFAQGVAKTWTGDEPADDAFTLDTDDVEKDVTGSWASGDSDASGGRDSVGSGKRNAGTRKPGTKSPNVQDDDSKSDDDGDGKELPKAPDERRLACPNCGHEFAADLPVDPSEQQLDDDHDNNKTDDEDKPSVTRKSLEPAMTLLTDTLDTLKALAAESDTPAAAEVAKTGETTTETVEVEKAGETLDVAKLVAASHKAHEDRFAQLEGTLGEAFDLIAKSHQQIVKRLDDMPQGRKSVARIIPPNIGHEEQEEPIEKRLREAPDALSALKLQNEHLYGIAS